MNGMYKGATTKNVEDKSIVLQEKAPQAEICRAHRNNKNIKLY